MLTCASSHQFVECVDSVSELLYANTCSALSYVYVNKYIYIYRYITIHTYIHTYIYVYSM